MKSKKVLRVTQGYGRMSDVCKIATKCQTDTITHRPLPRW